MNQKKPLKYSLIKGFYLTKISKILKIDCDKSIPREESEVCLKAKVDYILIKSTSKPLAANLPLKEYFHLYSIKIPIECKKFRY